MIYSATTASATSPAATSLTSSGATSTAFKRASSSTCGTTTTTAARLSSTTSSSPSTLVTTILRFLIIMRLLVNLQCFSVQLKRLLFVFFHCRQNRFRRVIVHKGQRFVPRYRATNHLGFVFSRKRFKQSTDHRFGRGTGLKLFDYKCAIRITFIRDLRARIFVVVVGIGIRISTFCVGRGCRFVRFLFHSRHRGWCFRGLGRGRRHLCRRGPRWCAGG
mmetsp:Transcript_17603/g.33074  ORF Transcript_17603/g.33074 Transcript_17603/m.33074 type:complete len:219 (-) Transcript_17603:176-832(-)